MITGRPSGAGRSPDRVGPGERYGLRLLILVGAVALLAIPFATITFTVIEGGPLITLDGNVADSLNGWVHRRTAVLTTLEAVSWMGRPPVLAAAVALAALWCLRRDSPRLATFLVATTASGAVLGSVVKIMVDRPRPLVDHPVSSAFGDSFPSGHAMHSTVAYGAIALVVVPVLAPRARRWSLAVTVAAIAAIGSSRLLLGLHFLTDVVGGYLLGAAWLSLGAAAFQTWRREQPGVDTEDDRIGVPDGLDDPVRDPVRSGAAPVSDQQ